MKRVTVLREITDVFVAEPPIDLGEVDLDMTEMMFYQYLPVKMAGSFKVRAEPRVLPIVERTVLAGLVDYGEDDYVYITAKHGWATTENPLNRPGWHVDAWGHPEDRNYVWCDSFPTRYIEGEIGRVPDDDEGALAMFEVAGTMAERQGDVKFVQSGRLYEFDQTVVHATPLIRKPGNRRFVKVSVSPHKYNLKGNSINPLFDYDWQMHDRSMLRNDPIKGNSDYVGVPEAVVEDWQSPEDEVWDDA